MPDRIMRIALPRRAPNYKVALTPLADAMFQLLVFFMLSSNISPYALLPLRSGALAGGGAGEGAGGTAPPATAAVDPGQTAVWTVGREVVVAGGQRFGFDRLRDLAGALAAAGTARVLLIARADAQVQGLVQVAEELARQGVTDVQVASVAGDRP